MLRFTRNLHSSRISLQELARDAKLIEAQTEIGDFLQYYKTPKDLRPLIYRKKNSSELLSRDLWDPIAQRRITPLEPPKIPSKYVFGKLLKEAKSVDELYELKSKMLELSRKPKYTSSYHLNCFLEKSAELRKFPHALSFIYFQKEFKTVLNADNLNFILTMLYINPRKSFANTISKVQIAKAKISDHDDITTLLEAAIYLKFEQEIPQDLSQKISSLDTSLDISFQNDKSNGVLVKQIKEYRYKYLQLSPIAEQFKNADNEFIRHIVKFVKDYQQVEMELGIKDNFQNLKHKSLFRKPRKSSNELKEVKQDEN